MSFSCRLETETELEGHKFDDKIIIIVQVRDDDDDDAALDSGGGTYWSICFI